MSLSNKSNKFFLLIFPCRLWTLDISRVRRVGAGKCECPLLKTDQNGFFMFFLKVQATVGVIVGVTTRVVMSAPQAEAPPFIGRPRFRADRADRNRAGSERSSSRSRSARRGVPVCGFGTEDSWTRQPYLHTTCMINQTNPIFQTFSDYFRKCSMFLLQVPRVEEAEVSCFRVMAGNCRTP